jgi:hypothetical protein
MAVEIVGNPSTVKWQVQTGGAGLVSARSPDFGANGAYRLCEETGLITGIAAGTASAGHIFALRYAHATKLMLVTMFRARWVTVSGFTAAQEVGLQLFRTTAYTVAHSGGTSITTTGEELRKRATHGNANNITANISTTGALTNGTHTIGTHKLAAGSFAELAAGAAVPKGFFEIGFKMGDPGWEYPLVLSQNQGLILRNSILMGAGGTARVAVEMEWLEVDSY